MAHTPEPPINIGLCVYGIPYTLGLLGRGTPRENPGALDTFGFLELAARLGLSSVELPRAMCPPGGPEALRARAAALGLRVVAAGGRVSVDGLAADIDFAAAVGASVVRCTLSNVLCGDRSAVGGLSGWRALRAEAAAALETVAPLARERGIRIGIENHQDATSEDLLWLCEKVGPPVGVTLDAGNPLAVGEDPLAFAERLLPHIVNVHLKDYWMFGTPSGFRLVHCPIGAGVVDFAALFRMLDSRPEVCRNIEMAALGERHVRILEDGWWAHYPPRDVREVLPVLRLWRAREQSGEWRTPWDLGESDRLAAWERERLEESVARMRALVSG